VDDNSPAQNDPTVPEAPENTAPPAPPVAPPAPPAAPFAPPAYVVPSPAPPAPPVPPVYGDPAPVPPLPGGAGGSGNGKTVAIVIAIIGACILVLIGLGVAIFLVAQSAIRSAAPETSTTQEEEEADPRDPGDEASTAPSDAPEILPLVAGDPGPAVAANPLVCPGECFPLDVFGDVGLDASTYDALAGLAQTEEWGDYADTTPSKEYTYAARYWTDNEGTPPECFSIYIQVPLATPFDVRPDAPDDTVGYLGYYESPDAYSGLQESARLFTDSASAEAHMSTFKDLVASCTEYEIGSGSEYWTADVSPVPALDLPDSVAAVGWVEDSPFGSRYYAIDLQRGNLVVRAALYTDGGITEEEYREYVEELAQQLAELEVE
jgi:hypothetical protein